jgi:hypothetical protein
MGASCLPFRTETKDWRSVVGTALGEVDHPAQRAGSIMTCERPRITLFVGAERPLVSKPSRTPHFEPLNQRVATTIPRLSEAAWTDLLAQCALIVAASTI